MNSKIMFAGPLLVVAAVIVGLMTSNGSEAQAGDGAQRLVQHFEYDGRSFRFGNRRRHRHHHHHHDWHFLGCSHSHHECHHIAEDHGYEHHRERHHDDRCFEDDIACYGRH